MAEDYAATRAAQVSNAAAQLGLTNVSLGKGQESRFWPNLTPSFALALVDYWTREASLVQGHVAAIPSSAIRTAWLRAVDVLKSQRAGLAASAAKAPHVLLPAPVAVLTWTSIDGVALPLAGIAATPTKWTLIAESVEEAVHEVGAGTRNVLYIVLAALALVVVLKMGD